MAKSVWGHEMKIRHHDIIEIDLGPLTSTVMKRARCRGQNEFPSSQRLADEVNDVEMRINL